MNHVTQAGLCCPPDPDVLQEVQIGFWFLQLLDSVFVNCEQSAGLQVWRLQTVEAPSLKESEQQEQSQTHLDPEPPDCSVSGNPIINNPGLLPRRFTMFLRLLRTNQQMSTLMFIFLVCFIHQ